MYAWIHWINRAKPLVAPIDKVQFTPAAVIVVAENVATYYPWHRILEIEVSNREP